MNKLHPQDLLYCVRRLPAPLVRMMKSRPNGVFIAGGYVRACVSGETISDIDVFTPLVDTSKACALELSQSCGDAKIHETGNALTVKLKPIPVQFIHRWTFATPAAAIESFDFTIARASFWWNGLSWDSCADSDFYADLAAKRLVYKSPTRIEEAGGSMLRVLKFYQRGYRIPLDSLGAVIARLESAVDHHRLRSVNRDDREIEVAKVLTGFLHEVDPSEDPDHIAHLPRVTGEEI